MTDTPREPRVLQSVVALVDTLLDDFDVVDLLTELTERCTELLDVSSAGLLLADPLNQLRLLAVTTEDGQRGRSADRSRPLAAIRPRGTGRRFCRRARRPHACRGHGLGRARDLRHPPPFTQRRGPSRRPNLGPHRVGRTPAATPAHSIGGGAATAQCAHRPRPTSNRPRASCVESLDVSVGQAFRLLRGCVRAHGDHLTDAACRFVTDRQSRPGLLAAPSEFASAPIL